MTGLSSQHGSGLIITYDGREDKVSKVLRGKRASAHDDLNESIVKNVAWGDAGSFGAGRRPLGGDSQGKIPVKTRKMFEMAGQTTRRRISDGRRESSGTRLPPPMLGMTMGHGIIS